MSETIVLLENESQLNLLPFTLTRSAADIRIGILTIREKWALLSSLPVATISVENSHQDSPTDTIPANLIPGSESINPDAVWQSDHRLIQHPWQLVEFNDWALRNDFRLLTHKRISQPLPVTVSATNPGQIFIEEGARLEHCFIHAGDGPVYIGKNALIMDGAMLRGPVSIGEGAIVKMGAAIYGATTIGPFAVAGGEIKNSILMAYANKAHHGYLGDAVIGEWCNLGAGTSCSNLKNTGGTIKIWDMHRKVFKKAGQKCGLLMGDFSKSAINTSFNTGTVTGICANIFDGGSLTPKFIPSFSWGIQTGEEYLLEKALAEIAVWMKFKNVSLTDEKKQLIEKIYKAL